MQACHHVAIVVWGTVRGVPSIISLPSPVKVAFSPFIAVLFLKLNLYKATLKIIMKWSLPRAEAGLLWRHHSVVKFRWKFLRLQSP